MADQTQSEDAEAYFTSQGFDAVVIDGHNLSAISGAVAQAKGNDNGRPKVIIAKTIIGKGIPEVEGSAAGHGEGGAKFSESARKGLGLPEETFYVSEAVRTHFTQVAETSAIEWANWQETFKLWSSANPKLVRELEGGVPSDLLSKIPEFEAGTGAATRASGGTIMQSIAGVVPQVLSGSADLYGSTKNYIKDGGDFGPDNFAGRNIWFGIREHGMGAICNGIAYDGIFKISGATFLVFADYMRGSIRLASLAKLPVTYIFTHDSVGVGEDGPTHQPVETVSSLRVIPNLDVIRPADAEETAGAFAAALQREDGPSALVLTRQNIPAQDNIPISERRDGVIRGGYIAKKESTELELILMATGSELQHAMDASEELGGGVRVVSLPCFERFDRQSAEYIESVLPSGCAKRIAVEAGVSSTWGKYVGLSGKTVCIDRFGMSAPGDTTMEQLGMSAENIVKVAKEIF
jgi:transketolase